MANTMTATEGLPNIQVSGKQRINAVIASVLGWSLDLFDLFILLYVAPVISILFFLRISPCCLWRLCMLRRVLH